MVGFKVIIFALTLISYTTWVQANVTKNNLGTIGGLSVSNAAAPYSYVVALFKNGKIIGTGSIIHQYFILTSASVVARANNASQGLIDGVSGFGRFIEVDQPLCHENFTENENDICLLKLSDPVTLWPNVAKIDLPGNDLPIRYGLFVNITGWGETQDGNHPEQMARTEVPLMDDRACTRYYPSMNDNKICATPGGLNFCWGNSGAPMTYNNVQIGVASLHYHKNCAWYPSIYTKVFKYMDWINTKISNYS